MDKSSLSIKSATPEDSSLREYLEVLGAIAIVTLAGWFSQLDYHSLGLIYLLTVILLCIRVGRWPVLFAAVISALVWNFLFIPPRWSMRILNVNDLMLLVSYLAVALMAGQFTSRIRAQERYAHLRERQATALFHLTRAIAGARTLDEAMEAALRQADELLNARTALLLVDGDGGTVVHAAGSLFLPNEEREIAAWVMQNGREAGRFTKVFPSGGALYLPLLRVDAVLGVWVLHLPPEVVRITPEQHELVEGFSAQIALLIERERLRAASEREKLFAESDRLHRTLLDSVSHELKTPLAVLRSAGEKMNTEDREKRASLTSEVRTATRRLDHLVANLLDQTRLESGTLKPKLDWCDVRDLVGVARRAVGDALVGRLVHMEIPPDLPLFLADTPLMEHVIANLLLNAALHTPAGSPILITAGLEPQRNFVFLRIADRGPGISPELQKDLFQKFHRGKSARAGGLGLGLSIVRGFMLAQGGEVEAGNNPEGGACFTVRLPFSTPGNIPNDES